MSVNLKNKEDFNRYVDDVISDGIGLTSELVNNLAYRLENRQVSSADKETIVRAMVYEWMKKRVPEYFDEKKNTLYLQRVTTASSLDETWLKNALAKGDEVYYFDEEKVPEEFYDDLRKIKRHLYRFAASRVDMAIKSNKYFNIHLLKHRPEYNSFALTLAEIKKQKEKLSLQESEQKLRAREKESLEQDTKIIMNFDDGYKVVRLMTPVALDKESEYMGHCVGYGEYDVNVLSGTTEFYSIRDANSEPHVTIAVEEGRIVQCRGKGNKGISTKYVPYARKFVLEKDIDPSYDAKNMGLCIDIEDNIYDFYNIPADTMFRHFDLSIMDFPELPDLSNCTVLGRFSCDKNPKLTTLKNSPKKAKEVRCGTCISLISLEGCSENAEILSCPGCISLPSLKGCPPTLKEINCGNCISLPSLKGCPEGVRFIYCSNCTSMETLDGCPKGIERIVCEGCPIKYIPDYIPDEAIMGLSEEEIAACKLNWVAEKQKEALKGKFSCIASTFIHTY